MALRTAECLALPSPCVGLVVPASPCPALPALAPGQHPVPLHAETGGVAEGSGALGDSGQQVPAWQRHSYLGSPATLPASRGIFSGTRQTQPHELASRADGRFVYPHHDFTFPKRGCQHLTLGVSHSETCISNDSALRWCPVFIFFIPGRRGHPSGPPPNLPAPSPWLTFPASGARTGGCWRGAPLGGATDLLGLSLASP